jgi:hypothetical protein
MPTTSAPEATDVTVSVVPAMVPITAALGKEGGAPRPAGQKKPTGQGFVVARAWPATQKKPGGHGACVTLAATLGQKEPGAHCATRSAMLPAAVRHEPAVQGEHCAAPAPLKRPGGHGMGATAAAGV